MQTNQFSPGEGMYNQQWKIILDQGRKKISDFLSCGHFRKIKKSVIQSQSAAELPP
jgi:hypothetical protein